MITSDTTVRPWHGAHPTIHPEAFVMEGVRIIGDVVIGAGSSIWYNTVIRGDVTWVRIGADSNVQDGCILHVTAPHNPLIIGDRVTIGHGVKLHGCTLEDESFVGIGAIVLDGAVVESGALVAAGAVVPPRMRVPAGTVVAGVPAQYLRDVKPEELADRPNHALRYRHYALEHSATMPNSYGH